VQGCFNDGEDGAVVAEERKHSGGAQVVRNDPSSPLCSDPPVSVLLFFPKVFLLCFVLLASVFLFLHSARSRFPLCHCPSLLLQNFAPPVFFFSPVFIGSRGRGSPYPVQVQGMVAWDGSCAATAGHGLY